MLTKSLPGLLMAAWLLSAGAASSWAQQQQQPAARRPNVIFFLTDDQGSVDVNCYGAHDLDTPNMDAIAAAGTRFTQFEAAAAICSPSRAAILTGKYPARVGLGGGMASSIPGGHGMSPSAVTMAQVFKEAGYATGHFGKWHLGYVPEEEPNAKGFAESLGFMGGCIDSYSHFYYWQGPDRHDLWHNGTEVWQDGHYFPDMITDAATAFIDQHKGGPFLIYLAFNQPHYPLQGTSKWRDRYKNTPMPRRLYAEAVSTADEHIGTVLAKVASLGLANDTIICFMSDQGHSTETPAFGGGGSAGPYRGAKFSLFEGGTRIPAMISWPGHLPAGQVRNQTCSGCDWLPTLAELAGVKLPADDQIDGRSLTPVIRSADAPTQHATLHWQSDRREWAVREGDWKLIGNPIDPTRKGGMPAADASRFLSDLAHDVGEQHNAAADHPDIVEKLQKLHEDWATHLAVAPGTPLRYADDDD